MQYVHHDDGRDDHYLHISDHIHHIHTATHQYEVDCGFSEPVLNKTTCNKYHTSIIIRPITTIRVRQNLTSVSLGNHTCLTSSYSQVRDRFTWNVRQQQRVKCY